jgi:hypothetical protein
MDESNPYVPPRSELHPRGRVPAQRKRSRRVPCLAILFGCLAGIVAGSFIAPPLPLKPIEGDLIWLSIFGALGGIAGAIIGFAARDNDARS